MYQPGIPHNRRGWAPILYQKKPAVFPSLFEAEAHALTEIKNTQTVRAPEVITYGAGSDQAYLVLEYIEEGGTSSAGQAELGTQLARLHRVNQPFFGWSMDNCIGATPSPTHARMTGYLSIGITAWFISLNLPPAKAENLRVPKPCSIPSIPFSITTPPTPLCSMEICGEGMPVRTAREILLFLIRRLTMGTGRQTWLSPICLVDFPPRFIMPTNANSRSTRALSKEKLCIISTMSSIISIYLEAAMHPPLSQVLISLFILYEKPVSTY